MGPKRAVLDRRITRQRSSSLAVVNLPARRGRKALIGGPGRLSRDAEVPGFIARLTTATSTLRRGVALWISDPSCHLAEPRIVGVVEGEQEGGAMPAPAEGPAQGGAAEAIYDRRATQVWFPVAGRAATPRPG